MIYKDLDPFLGTSRYEVAGRKAEEQMAHYLRRFFGDSPDIDVLNYLRIELDGEVAQMDHLLLLPYGIVIVESKSVSEKVEYREDGQWLRWYQGRPEGMRSPVTQAQMQAMLLRSLLNSRVQQKGFFDDLQLDVLVAVSDSGVIEWPRSGPLSQVCKADQVPGRIHAKLDECRSAGRKLLLPPEYRRVVAGFLGKMHRPLQPSSSAPPPVSGSGSIPRSEPPTVAPATPVAPAMQQAAAPTPKGALPPKSCKHCGAQHPALHIAYGQYGYYFSCHQCSKNTGLRFSCPACGGEGRLRKDGPRFFAECRQCEASAPFFTNP